MDARGLGSRDEGPLDANVSLRSVLPSILMTGIDTEGIPVLPPSPDRPKLTAAALRRWLPVLVRRVPHLVSAYLVPGRVAPRLREATMLGVTSVNRCRACDRVHRTWARATGLTIDDPLGLAPDAAAAYAYGQAIAIGGPRSIPASAELRPRHGHELEAVAILMGLANLAGNRSCLSASRVGSSGSRGHGSRSTGPCWPARTTWRCASPTVQVCAGRE